MAIRKMIPAHLFASTALTQAPEAQVAPIEIPRAEAPREFVPSPQQADFFRWIETGTGSCILIAVAGAGKTTTLLKALPLMSGSIFLGAYNKDIAKEMKEKAEKAGLMHRGLRISTMHGAGFSAWRYGHKDVKVDDRKVGDLITAYFEEHPVPAPLDLAQASTYVSKMVAMGKQFLMGVRGQSTPTWEWIEKHFQIDDDLPEQADMHFLADAVDEIFERSARLCDQVIDFDDMIYAPIAFRARIWQNDWVLIDECQDINPARLELAKRMLKPGGRLVAVGDPRQAIYGFTGADAEAVEKIKATFRAVEMPLTVTYRCPKAVVRHAHQWVTHIQAHETAPEGVVRPVICAASKVCANCAGTGRLAMPGEVCGVCFGKGQLPDSRPWFQQDRPGPQDVVLCRYTRPLIQTAYAMIKAGHPCKVLGREIGKGLVALCTRWKVKSLEALEDRLSGYLTKEIAKAIAKKNTTRELEIADRVGCIRLVIQGCRERGQTTVQHVVDAIMALFEDKVEGVTTLCTGHRSKGREWARVYWIQASQKGRPLLPWQAVQEDNLNYVITTRAMRELVLIPEGTLGA